jgi:hypothetical protein
VGWVFFTLQLGEKRRKTMRKVILSLIVAALFLIPANTGAVWADTGAPTVISTSPTWGIPPTAFITITGTNFTGATVVDFGPGTTTVGFTVVSDTQITAFINIDANATPGKRDVSVTNSAGTGTLTGGSIGGFYILGVISQTWLEVNPQYRYYAADNNIDNSAVDFQRWWNIQLLNKDTTGIITQLTVRADASGIGQVIDSYPQVTPVNSIYTWNFWNVPPTDEMTPINDVRQGPYCWLKENLTVNMAPGFTSERYVSPDTFNGIDITFTQTVTVTVIAKKSYQAVDIWIEPESLDGQNDLVSWQVEGPHNRVRFNNLTPEQSCTHTFILHVTPKVHGKVKFLPAVSVMTVEGSPYTYNTNSHGITSSSTDQGDTLTVAAFSSNLTRLFVAINIAGVRVVTHNRVSEGNPDIIVAPTTIDFGSILVGSSSTPQTVTVTNDGKADLRIDSVALDGTNYDQFLIQNNINPGQIIHSGSSSTLQVEFVPTSDGAKTASLTIQSNDPCKNPVSVTLNGTTPVQVIDDLISEITALNLQNGADTALIDKLTKAIGSLNNSDTANACHWLDVFKTQVTAHLGTGTQAQPLQTAADTIKASIGCL